MRLIETEAAGAFDVKKVFQGSGHGGHSGHSALDRLGGTAGRANDQEGSRRFARAPDKLDDGDRQRRRVHRSDVRRD